MAEWKRKLYEKILILYPVFVGVWGDKPVIFLYSSIFLYPMLYSCRNSFGKWNFFVIFFIYIPKKVSLIIFKILCNNPCSHFCELTCIFLQELQPSGTTFLVFHPILSNETNSQPQGEALLASQNLWRKVSPKIQRLGSTW